MPRRSPQRSAAGRVVLAFTREGFVCLDPEDGNILIEKERRSTNNASVNAATPIFIPPNRVFLSACYDVGACLWEIAPGAGATRPIWDSGGKLDCHYATPVRFEDHMIGFHGRQETGTVLRCIETATGEVAWSSERLPAGSVSLVGSTLLVLTERGELLLAEASAKGFKPSARGQILGKGTRAMPAIGGGQLFARDEKRLVCVKLDTPAIGD